MYQTEVGVRINYFTLEITLGFIRHMVASSFNCIDSNLQPILGQFAKELEQSVIR